ncbi:hypothetical protein BKA82DRAFT_4050853 [Pisolithus tinctorius]|nr:hypothetical protein BKA82DRAFT_4050853 [Pisolithus tinctorius]
MCLQKISFTTAVTCFNSLNVTTIRDMCIAIYGSYGHNARCMNAGEGRECGKRGALSDPRWEQDPVGGVSCEDGWIRLAGCAAPDGSANAPGTPDWVCEEREQSGVRRREWSSNAWNEQGTGGTGMREKDVPHSWTHPGPGLKVVLSPKFLPD